MAIPKKNIEDNYVNSSNTISSDAEPEQNGFEDKAGGEGQEAGVNIRFYAADLFFSLFDNFLYLSGFYRLQNIF